MTVNPTVATLFFCGLLGPGMAVVRSGQSYQVNLTAPDGLQNSFTVHEPLEFDTEADYAVVIQGHGMGSSRDQTGDDPFNAALRSAGYYVVSFDQRGHGESGGDVEMMNPDSDGDYLLQILNFVRNGSTGDQLPVIKLKRDCGTGIVTNNTDCVGAIGYSYGGMFQFLLSAIDPEGSIKAMVPEIAPYDLLNSFAPNSIDRSAWSVLLSDTRDDPQLRNWTQEARQTGSTPQQAEVAFLYHSFRYFCDEELASLVDPELYPEDSDFRPSGRYQAGSYPGNNILHWSSPYDNLFPLNEEYNAVKCNKAKGGNSRYFSYGSGHGGRFA
eukprot:CAMPEP_0170630758 /NCGR_PEP_ID=MMETSP0224-20130122/34200_1 /TAXON_ID=285029 /ORGANISM="Togula jolla, Strain CCCM 725" /LENGTH=325 /DNA_ID=CAMNT_0010958895 /DNA_START=28 /DNA_END=1002 /DNA_ORIENTATION=+